MSLIWSNQRIQHRITIHYGKSFLRGLWYAMIWQIVMYGIIWFVLRNSSLWR